MYKLIVSNPASGADFFVVFCSVTARLATSNSKKASASSDVSLTYVRISCDVEQADGLMKEGK
jgi:hypothetical protein